MKRYISKGLFVLVVCLIGAGPALALPLHSTTALTVSAPHTPTAHPGGLLELLPALPSFGMAIRVKDVGSIARKFVSRAQAAQPDYTEGVKTGGQDWETNTKAAEDNYKQGVTAAAARGAFGKGVAAAGQAKYVNRASTLGAQRFASGIAAAEGEFAKGIAPVLQVLSGLNLPPRAPKGDPRNQERANVVARELRKMKVGA